MKNLTEVHAFTSTITVDGTDYQLLWLPEESSGYGLAYNFYLKPLDGESPFCFTIGMPADQQTAEEAFAIAEQDAIANIDIYRTHWE